MYWAISHQLTDAQWVPDKQRSLPAALPFYCWSQCHVVWHILCPDWVSCPDCVVPSQHLMHPQLIFTGSTAQEAEKSLNVNTSQQQLKYVIKIILILDLKQSTFPASRKKINMMLAETRTHCNGKSVPNRTRHFHFKCTFHFSSNWTRLNSLTE